MSVKRKKVKSRKRIKRRYYVYNEDIKFSFLVKNFHYRSYLVLGDYSRLSFWLMSVYGGTITSMA